MDDDDFADSDDERRRLMRLIATSVVAAPSSPSQTTTTTTADDALVIANNADDGAPIVSATPMPTEVRYDARVVFDLNLRNSRRRRWRASWRRCWRRSTSIRFTAWWAIAKRNELCCWRQRRAILRVCEAQDYTLILVCVCLCPSFLR